MSEPKPSDALVQLIDKLSAGRLTLGGYPGATDQFDRLKPGQQAMFLKWLEAAMVDDQPPYRQARRLLGQTLSYVDNGLYQTDADVMDVPGHRQEPMVCSAGGPAGCSHELARWLHGLG